MSEPAKKWKRYRFYTPSVEDPRPWLFNPRYPWWLSGEAGDGSYAVIVAYLPSDQPLEAYWNDAFEVEYTEEEEISFSERFPKPDYFKELWEPA